MKYWGGSLRAQWARCLMPVAELTETRWWAASWVSAGNSVSQPVGGICCSLQAPHRSLHILLLQENYVERRWPHPTGLWVGAWLSLGVPSYAPPPALNWQWNTVQGMEMSNVSSFTLSVPLNCVPATSTLCSGFSFSHVYFVLLLCSLYQHLWCLSV
jgi:hypothetical protein